MPHTLSGPHCLMHSLSRKTRRAPRTRAETWCHRKKLSKKAAGALDFSKRDLSGEPEADDEEARIQEMKETYLPDEGEGAAWDEADAEWEDDAADDAPAAGDGGAEAKGWFASSKLSGFIATATGNKVLENEDLAPVLEQMREQLISKNVAAEIAEDVCASVGSSLEGQKLGAMARIAAVTMSIVQDPCEAIAVAMTASARGAPSNRSCARCIGVCSSCCIDQQFCVMRPKSCNVSLIKYSSWEGVRKESNIGTPFERRRVSLNASKPFANSLIAMTTTR